MSAAEDLRNSLARLGFPLPWTVDGDELLAADGTVVLIADSECLAAALPDEPLGLVDLVMIAVHTCAGLKARLEP